MTFSWAATPDPPHHPIAARAAARRANARIALTILHGVAVLALVAAGAPRASAQQYAPADPFAPHRWHFEAETQAALEAWNYNGSHEELYGVSEGLSYGLSGRVALTLAQRTYYLSERGNDSWVLGLTCGVRVLVMRRGRILTFLEGDVGISDAAIAVPPRGTRFNYLALGSGGILVRVRPRVHALAGLQLIHLSNASLEGPGRNPDIESFGARAGLVIGF